MFRHRREGDHGPIRGAWVREGACVYAHQVFTHAWNFEGTYVLLHVWWMSFGMRLRRSFVAGEITEAVLAPQLARQVVRECIQSAGALGVRRGLGVRACALLQRI